eukprot:776754-Prorocentrum_minimum.AAC.1
MAVEKVSALEVGMVVLRGISLVITPPTVSTPSERGVTSRSTRPCGTPPTPSLPPNWRPPPSFTSERERGLPSPSSTKT